MPKGKFGLRQNSLKLQAAEMYETVSSPDLVKIRLNSRQLNVLHEVHERGYPVYILNVGRSWRFNKTNSSFCMVNIPNPRPFSDCIQTDDEGFSTISYSDAITLGMPIKRLNLVTIALIPSTLFRAASSMRLKLTNALHGSGINMWPRETLSRVTNEMGIPPEHFNDTNRAALSSFGIEPEMPFNTLGSQVHALRISSYE